jgi:hypothetical protein
MLVREFIRQSGCDPTGLDDYQLKCLAGAIVAATGRNMVR